MTLFVGEHSMEKKVSIFMQSNHIDFLLNTKFTETK